MATNPWEALALTGLTGGRPTRFAAPSLTLYFVLNKHCFLQDSVSENSFPTRFQTASTIGMAEGGALWGSGAKREY